MREISELPFAFASAVANKPCETSFHGGVWQKSGASKSCLRRPTNVRQLLLLRNISGTAATIFS
jgi:hypothetical protein